MKPSHPKDPLFYIGIIKRYLILNELRYPTFYGEPDVAQSYNVGSRKNTQMGESQIK